MSRDELAAALTEVAEGRIPKVCAAPRSDHRRDRPQPRRSVGDATAAERLDISGRCVAPAASIHDSQLTGGLETPDISIAHVTQKMVTRE